MGQLYRVLWFALMVLVMAPAFILAGFVDGIGYEEARGVVQGAMQDMFYFPYALAHPLCYVVTYVAQLLPATSSLAVMAGEMLWEHIGVILTFVFFAFVSPPFVDKVDARFNRQARAQVQ
ncbi:hypothetical protein KC131_11260 [Pseudomonas sp. JQ170]|uniref:hypothetical protein n=1 Tax=unclassified Pseudomonas TaxID=196821 RepID=UPI002654F60C|nr:MULTISPECIES: hypothetical protein [unclassified Pseudomonas]MDN7141219.1 hypothetical protein [Pseudomonas sp. JQ170]WRO78199.1 hypothetical protein U9R80_11180 [Pseudomonas sp. 170C]